MIASSQTKPDSEPAAVDSPTLEHLETVVASGLPRVEEAATAADALLEIHKHKLYRPTYKSFKAHLAGRWNLSRSRGYQLLHFARQRHLSTTVDTQGPQNERQARALDEARYWVEGYGDKRDPVVRGMINLDKLWARLPINDRKDLFDILRDRVKQMGDEINNAAAVQPQSPQS